MNLAASQFAYGQSVTTPIGAGTVVGWDSTNTYCLVLVGGAQVYIAVSQLS